MSVVIKSLPKLSLSFRINIYINFLGKDVQNNFGRSDKLKIVNEEVGWWVRRVTVRLMRWSQRLRASPSPPLRDLICWATRIN